MMGKRLNHEPPAVTAKLGWRYHHIGIPHTQPRAQEHHVAHLGVHVSGFETSPYGIEWIRFEPHCDVPAIVRTVPHIAFAVDDLDEAVKGKEILIAPNEPSAGVRVAFILHDGAPVELLQFYEAKTVRMCTSRVQIKARYSCASRTSIAPSPTADATRFIAPARTSPAANAPGTLVSSGSGSRDSFQSRGYASAAISSRPVRTNPFVSRSTSGG